MPNGRDAQQIKRVRTEVLVALKLLYPNSIQAESLLRTLLGPFPTLEWAHLRRDLAYLCEKHYLERVVSGSEADECTTPWRRRWFKLTTTGMEVADRLIGDPALDA